MGKAAVLFLLGLFLVVKGGDLFVEGAAWLAKALGIPPFLVGATVVSLATTLPELLVSVLAAARGQSQMACGNGVGSVTANTALILSLSMVLLPRQVPRRLYGAKGAILVGAVLVLMAATRNGVLSRWGSLALVGLFVLFMAENIWQAKGLAKKEDRPDPPERGGLSGALVGFLLGGAGIVAGAKLMVTGATALAAGLGVPESIVGVTIVALGTSLPELVTSVTAATKGKADIAVGNIVGSNIFNILFVVGTTALITPVVYASSFLADSLVALGAAVLLWLCVVRDRKLSRPGGAIMLLGYAGYFAYLMLQ